MSTAPDAPADRAALAGAARRWWLLLVSAALWFVVGLVVLQLDLTSLATVGYLVGFMLVFTGIEQFMVASAAAGWRWAWILFGVLFLVGGIWMILRPIEGAAALASSLGLLFILIGVFWVVEAFAGRDVNSLWWLTLVSGLVMLGMGIWVGSQGLLAKTVTLLVFAGIWALVHAVGDIVRALALRRVGRLVTSAP